ncbi:MAG: peptidylprolyl isomerase [Chitinophagaceae bacterium]|nr:peptidylprolyl isomerase [Chitinophagaceae bacterium]
MKNCKLLYPLYLLFIPWLLLSCSHPKYKYPHVIIETNFGDIEVELYPDKAPKTVTAFLSYVDSGFYKNSSFYRVLKEENQPSVSFKSELIQGGIWHTNYKKGVSLPGIMHEPTNQTGILHKNGTISLARTLPGTANSEFFICVGDQPAYDYGGAANMDGQGYAAFGKVIKGMDIVKKIHNQPEYEESFDKPVEIFNIKRL